MIKIINVLAVTGDCIHADSELNKLYSEGWKIIFQSSTASTTMVQNRQTLYKEPYTEYRIQYTLEKDDAVILNEIENKKRFQEKVSEFLSYLWNLQDKDFGRSSNSYTKNGLMEAWARKYPGSSKEEKEDLISEVTDNNYVYYRSHGFVVKQGYDLIFSFSKK